MDRSAEPQRLGDRLLRHDDLRRNALALVRLSAIWAISYPVGMRLDSETLWLVLLALFLAFAAATGIRAARAKPGLTEAVTCSGAEEVGPLLRAADRPGTFVPKLARDALLRLLPALREEDAGLLSPSDAEWMRRRLHKTLSDPFADRKLARAILEALPRVGGPSILPVVEQVALFGTLEVREAAEACLPGLRERAARITRETTLLRPAGGPEEGLLVRPLAGKTTEENVLLRPDASACYTESGGSINE